MTKVQVSFVFTRIFGLYVALVNMAFFSSVSDLAGAATLKTTRKLRKATKHRRLTFLAFKDNTGARTFLVKWNVDHSMSSHVFKSVGEA